MSPYIRVTKPFKHAEDGFTVVTYAQDDEVEVGINCLAFATEYGYGEVIPAPEGGDESPEEDDDPDGTDPDPDPDDEDPDDPGDEDPDDEEAEEAEEDEVDATPAAVLAAETTGVDLKTVTGTGADGRVTLSDVEKAAN